jgi:hypothetical protein
MTDHERIIELERRNAALTEAVGDVLAEIDNAKRVCKEPHNITIVWARDSALEANLRAALAQEKRDE